MNVYLVELSKPVKVDSTAPHFSGKDTDWIYVTASSFPEAEAATKKRHTGCKIVSIRLLDEGTPILAGE